MVHSGINNGFDHLGLTSNAGKLPKLLPKPPPDVKMVYSGNGKLVCANNVFAQWALTLTVKARNRLAAELNLSVADRKEWRTQSKRYKLKLSQRRFRERKRQRKIGLRRDVQLHGRLQEILGSESSDDDDSCASHGSGSGLTADRGDLFTSSEHHNDALHVAPLPQGLLGALGAFGTCHFTEILDMRSESSDGDDSCASHGSGSGLPAGRGDLFTSAEHHNDAVHVAPLPLSLLGACHFTTKKPFEHDCAVRTWFDAP